MRVDRCSSQHVPGSDPASAGILGGGGLRDRAAVPHGGRRGHDEPRDDLALPRSRAVVHGVRRAEYSPDRWPLRGEPVPPAALLPVSGPDQAVAGRYSGVVSALVGRNWYRRRRARHPLCRGQLGGADAGRVGHWLGGLARRYGGHAVHVLPAGRRHRLRSDLGRDHVRPRAPCDVPAGGRLLLGPAVGARRHVRRRARPRRA